MIFFLPWLIPRIATLLMARGLVWLLFFLFYVETSDQKEKKRKSSVVIVMFLLLFFISIFNGINFIFMTGQETKQNRKVSTGPSFSFHFCTS